MKHYTQKKYTFAGGQCFVDILGGASWLEKRANCSGCKWIRFTFQLHVRQPAQSGEAAAYLESHSDMQLSQAPSVNANIIEQQTVSCASSY
jgi:hypothetical protein